MIERRFWLVLALVLPGVAAAQGEGDPEGDDAAPAGAAPAEAPAPSPPAAARAAEAPTDGIGLLQRAVSEFDAEVSAYREDVTELVEYRYQRKRAEIQGRYTEQVEVLSVEERARRAEAIQRFEEFLARYPDNVHYTPDALFRLAELHFERSNDAYITALEMHEEAAADFEAGTLGVAPAEPVQDYSETVALFDRLISRWPDYRNLDGAYYLKGYCLLEMGKEDEALKEFEFLVQKFPDSKFVPETWTRIGEYYFDSNRLPEAIAAYKRVLEFKDSLYFDKALYKLAWTYYRKDEYEAAIARFKELVEFSDAQAEKTGGAGSDLRIEAIQYLAISVQEEDWDGDGFPDEGSGFPRAMKYLPGEKAYEREIIEALVDIYFDNAKYEESIQATKFLIAKYPNNPSNPERHQRMIQAFERERRFDEAFAERDVLATAYIAGTPWYEANKDDDEVIKSAAGLAETALIQAATYHHTRAQDLKEKAKTGDASAEREAIREYQLAAVAYENYLAKYPDSENSYDLSYFYAECLYYSFRFDDAAKQYNVVRDSKLDTKYKEVAAFSAILAIENSIRQQIEAGQLSPVASLMNQPIADTASMSGDTQGAVDKGASDEGVLTVQPDPIPGAVAPLIAAREAYVNAGLTNKEDPGRTPRLAYKLGELYYDYKNYDEARKWFKWLVERYPQEKVAEYGAKKGLETYRMVRDWTNMEQWAAMIASANLGTEEDRQKLQKELNLIKTGVQFKTAEKLFNASQFEKAAEEYVRLVEEHPGSKFEAAALNNAAVAFEKTRRFESATAIYERIYRQHRQTEFAENALYRVHINAERFYDYDRAIAMGLEFVQQFPEADDAADALYATANLQEQTQHFREAAENFEKYARLFPARKDTAATFWRASDSYRKLKDTRNELRIYEQFVKEYGQNPENNAKVVRGLATIAERNEEQGKTQTALKDWQRVINEFNSRAMEPGTFEAQYPAKGRFTQIEQEFKKYEAIQLAGSLSRQGKTIEALKKDLGVLQAKYAEIIDYRSFEWTLAAFYRLGHIYQLFAEKLYAAPVPPEIATDPDAEDLYKSGIDDAAVPIEDEAVKRFETAVQKAREFKVTNDWTKRIIAALNKFKPSDYPLFKEERRLKADLPITRGNLIVPKPVEAEPLPSGDAEPPPADDTPDTPVADPGGGVP